MFGDGSWVKMRQESKNYHDWKESVMRALTDNPKLKAVIVEIGLEISMVFLTCRMWKNYFNSPVPD